MSRVYTKIRTSYMKMIAVFFAALLLTSCAGGNPFGGGANTGYVTDNPDSVPNIAWQTQNQRQDLSQQSKEVAAPEPAAVPPTESRKVSVSVLLPLSGKKSDLGQSMLKAAQMALFDIGSGGFQLVPRDTKGTAEGAANAARAAVAAKSDLILGPIFADDVKAVKPIAGEAGIPVVAFTTDWTLTGGDTYIMGFLPFIQVARVAKYAEGQGKGRFGVYAPKTEYCDVVIRTLNSSGVSVARTGRYEVKDPDMSALVADFAQGSKSASTSNQLEYDALMLPVGSEGLRSIVTALESHGISQPKVKFVGTGLWDDASLTTNPSMFGAWYAAPDPALRADFEKRYRENFGGTPMRLASLAYDATALAAVLARSSTDPTSSPYTHSAMTNPRGFAGIDGIFRFRSDGLSERGLAVLEIRSGRSVVVDPAPTAFIASGS